MPMRMTDLMNRFLLRRRHRIGRRSRADRLRLFLVGSRAPQPDEWHGAGAVRPGRPAGGGALLVLFGLYTGAALAGERATAPIRIDGDGRGVTVTVDRAFCERITAHRPAPDVAWQPGVDVHGRAVAPADLDGGYGADAARRALGDRITLDLGLPLERFGYATGTPLGAAEVDLGQISIGADGMVAWNGERLDDPAQNAVAAACARLEREGR